MSPQIPRHCACSPPGECRNKGLQTDLDSSPTSAVFKLSNEGQFTWFSWTLSVQRRQYLKHRITVRMRQDHICYCLEFSLYWCNTMYMYLTMAFARKLHVGRFKDVLNVPTKQQVDNCLWYGALSGEHWGDIVTFPLLRAYQSCTIIANIRTRSFMPSKNH